jgi:hypothetical protein
MGMEAILTALDKAEQLDVIAALMAVSLTAASFMAFLRSDHSGKMRLVANAMSTLAALSGAGAQNALSEIHSSRLKEDENIAQIATSATRALVRSFFFLAFNLVGTLVLHPFVELALNNQKALIFAEFSFEEFGIADLTLSAGTLGGGILLLVFGAKQILELVKD